jgi:Cu(I)/Ag(I) efflux system membrane protein CusA/SilA
MIERIIESSIRNRFLVLLLAAGLSAAGVYAVLHTPADAIPDLSENQVIVFTDWMGRSPKEIEDQITYPLSLKLQGLAGIKTIRSSSEFNFSMITIIFEDDIDFYFARQRVLEKLTLAGTFLPPGVAPYLAADATALGQIFWYTVEGGGLDPARLWALQKYFIGPALNAAAGVAEIATVGGMPQEYQIDVDPNALRAYSLTLGDVYEAVARSNAAVGGRIIQKNNAEYLVRGVGWISSSRDIENTVVKEVNGTPLFVKTVARVQLGTQFRRSVFEKDGNEVVGGVVMMRYGENPLAVTGRVKDKIQELEPGLPPGVRIVPAYDRTRLITGAISTLQEVMLHEIIIASLAILLILMHARSAFVICVTLPLSVLFSFLLMWVLRRLGIIDIQANIMSLAGITISIGILVDQAIVMTENATHHLKEHFGDARVSGDTRGIVIRACRTVGRPIFFSVMIMLVSFIPVFALSGRGGKLFHPLAFTKSFALVGVALLSVTVVPALIPSFLKGRLRGEEENWIVRSFINIYKPVLNWALPRRNFVYWAFAVLLLPAAGIFPWPALLGLGSSFHVWQIAFFVIFGLVTFLTVTFMQGFFRQMLAFGSLVVLGLWAYHLPKIGVEFMPTLEEGSILDMPVTVPRASVTQAADDIKARDALLRQFPEVESVIGKAGRADTPTDPAPLDMIETFVNLRPKELWPRRVMKFDDALLQTRLVLAALEDRGYVLQAPHADDRDNLIDEVAMTALARYDAFMRSLCVRRYQEVEREVGHRLELWRERTRKINWELFDRGVEAFTWSALEAFVSAAQDRGLVAAAPHGQAFAAFGDQSAKARNGDDYVEKILAPFVQLRQELDKPFVSRLYLWQRQGGRKGDLLQEMDTVIQVPGWSNIWTQPIANRIDMLATGVRTQIGVRVFGPDLPTIERTCKDVERVLKPIDGARDVVAEPIMGKGYLEITIDRQRAARYGVSVADIQDTIEVALGGRVVTQTVEGRNRFPVRIRYARAFREDEESVRRLLVSRGGMSGAPPMPPSPAMAGDPHAAAPPHSSENPVPLQIPLGDVASVQIVEGPSMIKSENGRLRNYVTLNVRGDRDVVGFVEEAQRVVAEQVRLPEGVHIEWSGEFEHQVRAARTLRFVFPTVILLIFVILYVTYHDLADAGLMMLAVPEALAGGAFFQFLFPKLVHGWSAPPMEFSLAVWVGYIACFGMATETGIIMLVYLREAIEKRGGLEKIASLEELRQAVIEGAVHRLRPKLLTEGVAILAIAPMLWATGVGAEVLAPMAVPVLGGLLISDEVVDIFLPVRFYWVRRARWLRTWEKEPAKPTESV